MKSLLQKARTEFENFFHYQPQCFVRAPGRVNLIGEHTDYNDGFVFPCAIDYCTVIASSKRQDNQVRVLTVNFNENDEFSLDKPLEHSKEHGWSNYVRGVFIHIKELYPHIAGLDLVICSNVPLGAGLSSSAALEVSIATTLKKQFNLTIEPKQLAKQCQKAENKFVGCNCGIMDQFISTLGKKDHALLIDCRSLETQSVPLPKGISVVIVNSNVKHGLVSSEYNARREQCEEAAHILHVNKLRDATMDLLEKNKSKMSDVVYKRARHVITENDRTLKAADALRLNDLATMSKLMKQSHHSMKNDFEITVPAVDTLVEIIENVLNEQGGVRMTGGGFGGCVVALAPTEQVDNIRQAVEKEYESRSGLKESFYVCHAVGGAEVINAS
ncbi:Galactokinase [Commensalibacter sp. Nvir]|uniref:galactokinase n=1 Tax=Commensalibacter sp. Nvir TaxID=3069817 RepID=UPI002D4BF68C|nr:Galactokinase [Commensalibacter sp. Nvir]